MAGKGATPQSGPKNRGIPGQQQPAPAAGGRTIESGGIDPTASASSTSVGPGGETGAARDRQVAQSTPAGSARVPEIPDEIPERAKPNTPAHSTVPREIEPKGRGATMARASVPPIGPAVIVRDLRKTPRLVGEAGKGMKDSPVEARTQEEAIELANAKGRAVLSVDGWVCPTIVKERIA